MNKLTPIRKTGHQFIICINYFQKYEDKVSYQSWPKIVTEREVSVISSQCASRKLEKEEIERYGRQMILPEIGLQGSLTITGI